MSNTSQAAIITGAGGHLGTAVAAAFRRHGIRLVLIDRQVDALRASYADAADVAVVATDLCEPEQVAEAVRSGAERFGRINAVCHLAGAFRMGQPVHETSPDVFDFLMDVNARTFVNLARATVPHLLEHGGGSVITVGAGAATKGAAQMGAYCASKSALMRLTEAMSAELKDRNINVNCVLPSIIDTPDNRAAMPDEVFSRWVSPAALADVIIFLCSDGARSVHGASIPVTGLI
ncbi:SDR family oxidoreductase [Cupriavidus sp. DL-D2]|uniref:SDR family oxidoreductase n=1 Tax=Cupriavidus sp. DL-D2 TaxID=3144974 RepID=UPI003213C0FF